MNKKNFALPLVFIILVALAFFLRLYRLDERVFHHDEAAVGYFTYKLFKDGIYSYDPSFHGPFMYFATSEIFRLLGDSDYSARLLPALLGAGLILFLIPLRKYIGSYGMIFAAFFLALSPSFLYYSRFYREDIFMAFFSLLTLACAVKYAEKFSEEKYSPARIFYLFSGAVALASMAALKENAYIMMALIVLFLLLLLVRERGLVERRDKKLILIAEVLFFVLVFLVAFSLYYTGNIFDAHGMKAAVERAVSHWYEMHRIQRIGGPLYFYIPLLAIYELPVLVFGLLGSVHYSRKNNLFMTFIVYWAMTNLIVYSYLQEKVPWLILNMLLPLTIIAASYLGELLPRLKFNLAGTIALIFLLASSSYFVYSSLHLNYSNYTNPAEPLIQAAQPPQQFSEFLGKINEISSQYQNRSTEIQLTDNEMNTQFLWYMRHFSNIKWGVSIDSELTAPLIVVHDSDDKHEPDIVKQRLRTDYERLDSAKMSWYWFEPSDITLDYLLYRKMDRDPGEYRVVLFYKPRP